MVEEHTTQVRTPTGDTHTHTEIVRDDARSSRGGAGWAIFIVLALALIVGAFFLMQGSGAEMAKDNAIANAANQVGDAAQSVGNAADQAAERIAE